jgi:hypothetical protein
MVEGSKKNDSCLPEKLKSGVIVQENGGQNAPYDIAWDGVGSLTIGSYMTQIVLKGTC